MKKLGVILIFIILTFCFSACRSSNTNEQNIVRCEWGYCGEIDAPGDNIQIYYDKQTKVMYARMGGPALTVLLNADGTPMLYEEESK